MTDMTAETEVDIDQTIPRIRRMGWRGWWQVIRRVAGRVGPSQIGVIAAGVAFYALLAAFPAIGALMALAGLFTDPDRVVVQLETVAGILPDEAATILINQANGVAGSSDEGLSLALWLGVAFAVYLSTRATTSMIHGLNVAFDEDEARGLVRFWVTVVILTAGLLVGMLLLVLLLVGLPTLLAFVPLDLGTERAIRYLRWVAVALVFMTGLTWLYRWGPSRVRPRWRWLTVGAVVAALCWFAGSIGFAMYVANFANYNETFGSLGGVIILLTWLWLSAFIVLLGALIDAEVQNELAKQLPDEERDAVGDQSRPVP